MPHRIVHVEFQVNDVQKAMQWYADLFGWQTEYDATTNYGMFKTESDNPIGGGFNLITEHPVGTVAYVETDDLQGMLKKAQEMGARLIQDETPIPGRGAYALISDPDGNAIGLRQVTG
jgi:predicted enzyme related to lactoylglutathione lyase